MCPADPTGVQKMEIRSNVSQQLFMESVPGPHEHEKQCINVLRSGHTGMLYIAHRSHWMQKHKFAITCPNVLFMKTALGPPEHEK
jgi:hypothetical protein